MNFVDAAGADMLTREAHRRKELGGSLTLCDAKPGVLDTLAKVGFFLPGGGELFASKSDALCALVTQFDDEICRNCSARIFQECGGKAGAQVAAKISAATVPSPSRLSMAISQP
jgi:SulP family sulfate permease